MKSIEDKSLIISALLSSVIILGVLFAMGMNGAWNEDQRWKVMVFYGEAREEGGNTVYNIPRGWEPLSRAQDKTPHAIWIRTRVQ